MPKSVYQMMFNDPDVKHLADNDISLEVYTDHQVNILGKCQFYVLHPDSKKPLEVTFYVASNEGSVLLSCTTLLALDLIQARPRLDYLPPRAKLITSAADHPDITKRTCHQTREKPKPQKTLSYDSIKNLRFRKTSENEHHSSCKPQKTLSYDSMKNLRFRKTSEYEHHSSCKPQKTLSYDQGHDSINILRFSKMQPTVNKLPKAAPMTIVKNKVDIKSHYADVFEGVGRFPGHPYHIQVDPKVPPKQTPVRPVPVHLKEAFKQELDKMLQAAYIKPVHEATPWINSYVIVEGKEKLGRLKIRICLDPTNLNVAVIREPWFSKTPDDIAHMLADAVIITATDCTKGFWHEALD